LFQSRKLLFRGFAINLNSFTRSQTEMSSTNENVETAKQPRKTMVAVWRQAFPLFERGWLTCQKSGKTTKFWADVAKTVNYANGETARNRFGATMMKWIKEVMHQSGKENTGGAAICYASITKTKVKDGISEDVCRKVVTDYMRVVGSSRKFQTESSSSTTRNSY